MSISFTTRPLTWRQVIKQNTRRSYMVMFTFLLIYTGLGFLCDVLIMLNHHPDMSFSFAAHEILSLKQWPWATLSMFGVGSISILVTLVFHDKLMLMGTEYHEVNPEKASDLQEKQLYNVVEEMKVAAGLSFMPKIYIIEADYMNAFASGISEKSAMIAITRGLMNKLNRQELQAVMAHELSHIRHQDIKLTLMVGVLSNLMLMVVDILFYNYIFGRNDDSRNDRGGNVIMMIVLLLRYVLPIITVLLMMYLSRTREYMADSGAVELMRENESLASALLKISDDHLSHQDRYAQEYGETKHEELRNSAYIFDPRAYDPVKSFLSLWDTHPSIEDRLKALGIKIGGNAS